MALRQRTDLRPTIPDENATRKLHNAKVAVIKPTRSGNTTTKRPALGELSNKPITEYFNSTKPGVKSAAVKQLTKPAVVKKSTELPDKKVVKDDNPKITRTESLLKLPTGTYSSKNLGIIDPDASSRNDPMMVVEYLPEIFAYLRKLEDDFPIVENFLDEHKTTPKMRAILVDWIIGAHANFKLGIETLYLCVSIIDRFLQINKREGRDTLQLVGTAALMVACKYEEMYVPDIEDFVYICDDTFTKRQIFKMEIMICKSLDFSFGRPLPIHFLRRYSKVGGVSMKTHMIGKYLLELVLMDYEMAHIKPSIVAAAATCYAMALIAEEVQPKKVWTPTLEHYSTYEYNDFKSVMVSMATLVVNAMKMKHKTVVEKYSTAKHFKISLDPILTGRLTTSLANSKKKL